MESFEQICARLEHWETPQWAAAAILKKEIMTARIVDAGCGTGVLSLAARAQGYNVIPIDVHDWGFPGTIICDFLQPTDEVAALIRGATVFMNPPFSRAVEFVETAFKNGARKVVCFQRFAWYESQKRAEFWRARPPSRIYICGNRATCWLHSIPQEQREKSAGSPTAHAFFVWEDGHPPAALTSHIFKGVLND